MAQWKNVRIRPTVSAVWQTACRHVHQYPSFRTHLQLMTVPCSCPTVAMVTSRVTIATCRRSSIQLWLDSGRRVSTSVTLTSASRGPDNGDSARTEDGGKSSHTEDGRESSHIEGGGESSHIEEVVESARTEDGGESARAEGEQSASQMLANLDVDTKRKLTLIQMEYEVSQNMTRGKQQVRHFFFLFLLSAMRNARH
jgi:hypothetical protein